jgi:membrane-bound lytic murein transglycosylase B
VQIGSAAVVAGGVAVFVTAALASPVVATHLANRTSHLKSVTVSSAPVAAVQFDKPRVRAAAPKPAPAAHKALHRKPTHAAKKAPVNHGVISGLAANGIPQVALNAYRVAATRIDSVDPGCGLSWSLLAGIGREESDHGQFAGAVLHADGVSTPRIIGPALDGKHWDYIPAPGNGLALDGDAVYAHALGPMQFIPSTWAAYGADANGDGKADIFNINDAALGAARYLCAAGGDLSTQAGQVRAVLAYNHNDQYLAQVLALANAYRTGIPVTGIPVGILTGALPKVGDTGYIPPANPGAPTAVGKHKHHHKNKHHHGGTGKHHGRHSGSTKHPKPGSGTAPGSGSGSGSHQPTKPTPSGGKTTPKPGPSSSAPSSPTPSPTKSCNAVQQLLHICK